MEEKNYIWKKLDGLRGYIDVLSEKNFYFLLALLTLRHLEENGNKVIISDKASWKNCNNRLNEGISVYKNAFEKLEFDNPKLKGAFSNLQLPELNGDQLRMLTYFINSLSIKDDNVKVTFELLLQLYFEKMGKTGGEIYSSGYVSKLMTYILDLEGGDVYDGTSGTGQTLIEAGNFMEQKGKHFKLWGQDINESAYSLSTMNMLIHGYDFEISFNDTLTDPAFLQENNLKQFDYVMMNPPFSLNWQSIEIEFDIYNRFKYGIPAKSRADWLFIQHAISSLKNNGKAAILTPLSILTSGGKDKNIRENILADDLIESIVILPANSLINTSIPTAIIVFNKTKNLERRGKIQFVNTTEYFDKDKRKVIFSDEKIKALSQIYHQQQEVKALVKFVSLEEIDDANLNYARYFTYSEVDSFLGEYEVDKAKYQKSFIDFFKLREAGEFFKGVAAKEIDRPGSEGDYYLLQMSDIQNGQVVLENILPIEGNITNRVKGAQVQEGDVLISSRGSSIKIAVVPTTNKRLILSQNLICFRPNEGYNSYYIKAFLESPVGMALFSINQTSSIVSFLNIRDIEDVEIPNLSKEEQIKIGNEVKNADLELQQKLKEAKEEYLSKYHTIYEEMGINHSFSAI